MSDEDEKRSIANTDPNVEKELVSPDSELHRGLKNRHAQMISIGGVIGTGLFLGTAKSLAAGGPLGLLLGYLIVSSACVSVMLCLGELTTLLPVPGGQITLAGRFVDPAMAFAMGWNYWYSWVVALPSELSATAILINYWDNKVNNAAWITMTGVVVIVINFLGTRAFGECEFWFASVKVITIIGLIILGLVIDLGGAPDHDRLGFRYWHNPGALTQYHDIPGATGRFAGFWSVLIGAAYAFLGTEILGMTAAETHNPTKNIPIAVRGVWVRILLFYILGVFMLGLICPYNDPGLVTDTGNAASSAWVIAIQRSGIKVLPHIANACFLTSAWSAGSSDLYTSSRALYGLAKTGQAPKIFARTNSRGTPIFSLALCAILGALSYMGVSESSSTVFNWFSNMSAVSGMFNWLGICLTGIRFRQGLKAQGISLESLPWHSKLTPYAAWWGLTWTVVIIIFADWGVFLKGNWNTASFITNYFPIPFFFIMFFGYKFWYKTKWIPASEMDFVTGVTSWKNR
ncbi:amino acid transporter [Thelephora terrestris]|uniref:Amino acid transporter n=1 Tax=Thelephora terrestris TaxID=56493 RepID=A0A9P6HJR5_9AGAM|nr:amino acid transporter [Thelephora terrestris]